jgi:hypothetical protein
VWWISEAVPIGRYLTVAVGALPALLGIDTMGGTATNYGKEIIFLFLGGFLLALALERVPVAPADRFAHHRSHRGHRSAPDRRDDGDQCAVEHVDEQHQLRLGDAPHRPQFIGWRR